MDEISIRRAASIADYQACQEAQRGAWGITDDSYVVPLATMVGAQLHGGQVLGAFLPDGTAIGMSFGFLGRVGGRLCLYSQLLGIVPGWQDREIGTRMKQLQRELARTDGLDWIAWAFDPLQPGNARFNLDKMGATAGSYQVDMYGPRTDALNVGVPTDRLIAEWPTVDVVRARLSWDEAWPLPRLIESVAGPFGLLDVSAMVEPPPVSLATLEIPADMNRLGSADAELAARWRRAVRHAFLAAFARGFRATGFARGEIDGQPRCLYVLERS